MNLVEEKGAVFVRLVNALLDDGVPLVCEPNHLPGRTNIRLQTNADSTGRLVGFKGNHLRSLQLIAEAMGRTLEQQWVLELADPEDERRGPKKLNPHPESHDPADSALLLTDLLEALGITAHVEVKGGIAGGYDFLLAPFAQEDEASLLDPHPCNFGKSVRPGQTLNLIAATGIIFRAIGRKHGVDYRCNIE